MGDLSQIWVGGVADSQTRSKPLKTPPNHPENCPYGQISFFLWSPLALLEALVIWAQVFLLLVHEDNGGLWARTSKRWLLWESGFLTQNDPKNTHFHYSTPLCYTHPTSWLCAVLILKLWRFTLFAHKSNKLLTAARASQGNIRGTAFTAIIRYMSLIIEINSRKIIPMYAGCYVNDAAVEIIILVWWWEPPPLHWGQTYMRPSISANQFKWVDKEFEIWNPLLRRDQCLIGKKLTNSNELNREKLNRREKQLSFLWCLMVCDLINSGI